MISKLKALTLKAPILTVCSCIFFSIYPLTSFAENKTTAKTYSAITDEKIEKSIGVKVKDFVAMANKQSDAFNSSVYLSEQDISFKTATYSPAVSVGVTKWGDFGAVVIKKFNNTNEIISLLFTFAGDGTDASGVEIMIDAGIILKTLSPELSKDRLGKTLLSMVKQSKLENGFKRTIGKIYYSAQLSQSVGFTISAESAK